MQTLYNAIKIAMIIQNKNNKTIALENGLTISAVSRAINRIRDGKRVTQKVMKYLSNSLNLPAENFFQ